LQERPRPEERGAEGANPDSIRTKLSGKRTVTYLNPGKIQVFNLDTEGNKSRLFRDNLSGKRTGGFSEFFPKILLFMGPPSSYMI